nr:zinc-dependent alcohol dehydrogenase family protein [Chloroflexota bacterium]
MTSARAMRLRVPRPIADSPLTLEAVDLPALAPRSVRVRLRACGLCHTDLHIVEGELPIKKMPITIGHQAVGFVEQAGIGVAHAHVGDRVGIPWLHTVCGACDFCRRGEENLCDRATFTGWDMDGGYAEAMVADEAALVPIPPQFTDAEAAPLLCAGIIGYRSLRQADVQPGEHVGLFGFGAGAHIALQVARHWGCAVSVFTRSAAHRALAESLGAGWSGVAQSSPPRLLDRAILFAPVGALIPVALGHIRKGGTLAINAIHMSAIPEMNYTLLYGERTVRSVANATRRDAVEFMALAAQIPVRTHVTTFALAEANTALAMLKRGELQGAGALVFD